MMHMYTVFILTTSVVGTIRSFSNYSNDDISPFHHFSSSNDFLFVGGKKGITVLKKNDLNLNTTNVDVGEVWLVLYNKQKDNVILCSKYETNTTTCRLLDTTMTTSKGLLPFNIIVNTTDLPVYVKTEVGSTNDVIVIGATSFQTWNDNNLVADYSIVTLNTADLNLFDMDHIKGPMNLERGPKFDIVFKSIIATDSFVFFFLQIYIRGKNTFDKSRVGKLCKKTKGDAKNNGDYHSYEDIGIKCLVNRSEFVMVERAVLVNNKIFVVILRNSEGHHAVCTYSVKAVLNQMTVTRKSQLSCNRTVWGSYFKSNIMVGDTQCFNKSGHCVGGDGFCTEAVNGTFCNSSHYSTLWDGTELVSNDSFYHSNQSLTAIAVHAFHDMNLFIVLIGTGNGSLILMNVGPMNDNKYEIHQNQVNLASSRIKDILIDQQNNVYLLSEHEVIKMTYHDCIDYFVCDNCESLYCNWMFSELQMEKNRFLIKEDVHQWIVKFNIKTGENVKSCEIIELTFIWIPDRYNNGCMARDVSLKNVTAGNYTFVVRTNSTNYAGKIELYRCEHFQSCEVCLNNTECGWHQREGRCKRNNFTYQDIDSCPYIISNDKSIQQIYATKENNITLKAKFHKNDVPRQLFCEFRNQTDKFTSMATVAITNANHSAVVCHNLNFLGESTQLSRNLLFEVRVRYDNDTYINNHTEIEVYTCSSNLSIRDDCSVCKDQELLEQCDWCPSTKRCYSSILEDEECNKTDSFCTAELRMISPNSGPINGGTIVTLDGKSLRQKSENITVYFDNAICTVLAHLYNHSRLECETSNVNKEMQINNISLTVGTQYFSFYNSTSGWFKYKNSTLKGFYPDRSILSGGRQITISGTNIEYIGENRYQVQFLGNNQSIECSSPRALDNDRLRCLSGNLSALSNFTSLEVVIDNNTTLNIKQPFIYVKDPSGFELSNKTASTQQSGGTKIKISGEGFNEVGKVTIDRVVKPCDIESDILVQCETPEYSGNGSITGTISQTVNVYFDGLAVQVTINYVGNPTFVPFNDVLEYEKGSYIYIKGLNILSGARWDDYTIYIGKTGICFVEENDITDSMIKCLPPEHAPLTNYTDQNLVYIHVKVGRLRKHIGEMRYIEETNYLVIVISVLAAALVIAVTVGIGAVLTMRKKRKKAEKLFMIELQSVEERIRTNSREEFAEMQIAIGDIQSDLVTSKVPYRDYQTYILVLLFPNQDPDTNSLLLNLEASDRKDDNYTQAVEKLELLMQNKLFLKSLVQTLDRSNTLTAKEKAQFAALISVAMLGKMRLFYDLVNCLLTDTIRSVTKKQQRSLFRRLDSITCRMMTHFLQIVMYKQLQGQTGMQLFLLLKSVQTVMENGPVDAVTGHCKNTLCEEKLLKLRVDSEQHTLNIDLNGNSDHRYQVKVLECDTISQVKRKCCYQIYKNTPASEIPKFEELELEWNEGQAGRLLLQDIDQTSERTDGHLRLNTLSHYNVKHDCRMSLMYGIHEDEVYENTTRQSECASSEDVNLLIPDTMEGYDNLVKWHLSMSHFEEGPNPERDFGDIYLNRLFHTKLLLSKYIDSMFEGLLDSKLVSLPISYFIQTLEKLGKESMVDPDVIQIWKNECYGTRLWAPMIAKPQAAFDIHVPQYVEPVMDVLSHVFVESVTQTHSKVNKESPTHRLMFHKDVERYRRLIDTFYSYMEPVADHDFWKVLDQLSDMQKEQVKLSRQSTIHQLYNLFIARHKDKILMDFEDMEESRSLQFGQKLEEIFDLMEEQ